MIEFIKNIDGELLLLVIITIQIIQHHRLEKRVKALEDEQKNSK